ncbi:hypothetical protein [Cyanobacterium sp. Dongsha4]|uniref:hypothetical protein n=1 Tax=Cyanobacterium sp. DS4 TaxID=2878255 RepID=UPI002E822A1B|nr:hypothetical protein [Cyanobacterium sp. Dongsha4]WVL00252.1 hypothetical protein Dongsha4_16610 [Cyanobacterium sp. Dongsha4]
MSVINYVKTNKGLIELSTTNQYTLQQINYLAFSLANYPPYAWAYNVAYLEQPHSFNLIIASDNSAHGSIYSALSTPKTVPAPLNYGFDESAVKTAMKELISNSFSPRHLKTISDAISNTLITPDNWHQIFNTERANRAVNERLKSDRIGRLLTLRAMIIPHTLGELIKWLEIEENEKNWDNCLQFSKSFYNSQDLKPEARGIVNDNLLTGAYNLIPPLLNQEIQANNVAQLLTDRVSVWTSAKSTLIENIHKDLDLIGKCVNVLDDKNLTFGQKIWNKLIEDRQKYHRLSWKGSQKTKNIKIINDYQPLTIFFNCLAEKSNIISEWILYAYFSQVSEGSIPFSKNKFKEIFDQNDGNHANCYYLNLRRKISKQEQIIQLIVDELKSNQKVRILLFVLLSLLLIGLGEKFTPFKKINNLSVEAIKILTKDSEKTKQNNSTSSNQTSQQQTSTSSESQNNNIGSTQQQNQTNNEQKNPQTEEQLKNETPSYVDDALKEFESKTKVSIDKK